MTNDRNVDDLEEARARMSVVAAWLAQLLGPFDAAAVLLGAAQGVLVTSYGREAATDWLRGLADATEGDGDGGPAGHA